MYIDYKLTKKVLYSIYQYSVNFYATLVPYRISSLTYCLFLRRFGSITIFADGGYRGELVQNVKKFCGWYMEITLRSDKAKGFEVLPMRWVVERFFSWLENFRRLAKDYEYSTQMSETMIHLAFTTIMLHRIKNE